MAIKSILTNQEDFTGEFPATSRTSALWRFNESAPDGNLRLLDSSGHGRHFTVSGWSGRHTALSSTPARDPVSRSSMYPSIRAGRA